jgi:hypothetical protein
MRLSLRTRRSRLVLTGLALALGSVIWAGMPDNDSPEARAVKEQFTRQAERIRSLEVAYSLNATSPLKPAQLLALAAFRNKLYLAKDEWTEAVKGEKRYSRQLQPARVEYLSEPNEFGLVRPQPVDPKAPPLVQKNQQALITEYDRAVAAYKNRGAKGAPPGRKNDPGLLPSTERDITRAFNGRTVWMRRPRDAKVNEFQVWPLLPKAMHWFGNSSYFTAVGLLPTDPTSAGHQSQKIQELFRLPDWFKNHAYTIEKTEVIDGSTCVVLQGSLSSWFDAFMVPSPSRGTMDRIWLDRDHGWAVRKREHSKDGQVYMRWENSAFRELEPGLWLPMIVRTEQFANDAPAEWRGRPVFVEQLQVHSLEVNQVPDDRFDMVPGKEDVIEDLRGMF